MIGNLRRDVEAKAPQDSCKPGAPTSERRFQPPRRRQVAAAAGRSNCSTPSKTAVANQAKVSHATSPQEHAAVRPQSVEITWLMRTCQRMDNEASEVVDFLARHGLDRYSNSLVNAASGIGASLTSLMDADEASLSEIGMTNAEQERLHAALQQELGEVLLDSESRPSSRSQLQSPTFAAHPDGHAARPEARAWGKLGAPPPGWTRVANSKPTAEKTRKVVLVDSSVGGDDSVEEGLSDPHTHDRPMLSAVQEKHIIEDMRNADGTNMKLSMGVLHEVDNTPATTRPPSASSLGTVHTPSTGSRRTGDAKACCYQCFRQVHLQHAVVIDVETADGASQRHFCSEACASSFSQASAARNQRVQELRAKVLREPAG